MTIGRLLFSLAVSLGLAVCTPARAAALTVDTVVDDAALVACDDATPNDCSLRGAIIKANGLPGPTTIDVPAGTYVLSRFTNCNGLSTPALCIVGNMTLAGAGALTTIIDAAQPPGVNNTLTPVAFVGQTTTAEIRGVTLTRGNFSFGGSTFGTGGGIRNFGTLRLVDSVVSDSYSRGPGGGIYNSGALTLLRSSVARNVALGDGGGIFNYVGGSLTITDSELVGNSAVNGGGLSSLYGDATVTGSTIRENTGFSFGGGVYSGNFRTLSFTNSTISGNRGRSAGGIYVPQSSTVNLNNVTIANNTARRFPPEDTNLGVGGGLYSNLGVVNIANSIVAGNVAPQQGPDCNVSSVATALNSQGYNLVQNLSGCIIGGNTTGNVTGVDPLLGPLADNGGPSLTHALLTGSPAIDAGNPLPPGFGGFACALADQRGVTRIQDGDGDGTGTCDIGAFELGDAAGGPALEGIRPSTGGNTGAVIAAVYGRRFVAGTTVKLTRAGQPDIVGQFPAVSSAGRVLTAQFDLAGRALGQWDLEVTIPGGPSLTKTETFTIEEGRAHALWADIITPSRIRAGRPSRLLLLYGNRGNVDAFGVPLVIGVPRTMSLTSRVALTPPPDLPGQPVIDWSRVPATMGAKQIAHLKVLSLFLPVVPAGFVGTLELSLIAPPSTVGKAVEIGFGIGAPYLESSLAVEPEALTRLTRGIRSYARRITHVGFAQDRDPQLSALIATQLQTVVAGGVSALTSSLATTTPVHAVPHLLVSLVAAAGSVSEQCEDGVDNDGDGLADGDDPDCQHEEQEEEDEDDDGDDGDEEECEPEDPESPWYADDNCSGEPDCKEGGFNTCAPPPCKKWPPTACGGPPPGGPVPIGPYDPNEKVGSLGAGAGHYVTGVDPLRYVVLFENVATATAPAQEVVITDQLDASTLDLSTFSLGPMSFGARTVVPPPGLKEFTAEVDLRPAQNVLCDIDTRLDPATGLLTWRLTSIDPATGDLPEDPDLGCLPPNATPPAGEGGIVFTVKAKAGLATNTEIRNQARIVFDVNPPIDTPVWLNTIDNSTPQSQVTAVSQTPCSQALQVRWSGTDVGSGIQSYDVFVSEDGGPFTLWLNDTTATTGTFVGQWGKSYAFYSVVRDQTGNEEGAPAVADRQATVAECGSHDLAVTKITVPGRVTLTDKNPQRKTLVKVEIQNRGPKAETIGSLEDLRALVALEVESLAAGTCAAPTPVLIAGKPQKKRPITLKSKQKLSVVFRVTFACANDAAQGAGHKDFRFSARVHQSALGGSDGHPADDVCPRSVPPPYEIDPNPDGRIKDKGCGEPKADKTLGDPVLVDVVVKR